MEKNIMKNLLTISIILLFVGASVSPIVGSTVTKMKEINKATILSHWNYLPDIIVPDDYPTIQKAIDNASVGDCIAVRNGTYNENIVVLKNELTLCGDLDTPTILQNSGDCNTILIEARNTTVADFFIIDDTNNTNYSAIKVYLIYTSIMYSNILRNHITVNENASGICLTETGYANISGNMLTGKSIAFSFDIAGISLYTSDYFSLSKNKITGFGIGIYLENCHSYTTEKDGQGINSNKISGNGYGISSWYSSIGVYQNEISQNSIGILLFGPFPYISEIFENNIINNSMSLSLIVSVDNIHHNNIVNDSALLLIEDQKGLFVKASSNYWGKLWINPRHRTFPLFAPIIFFPWLLTPIEIQQTWPD
jgi:parallel beta-helix repeat protein